MTVEELNAAAEVLLKTTPAATLAFQVVTLSKLLDAATDYLDLSYSGKDYAAIIKKQHKLILSGPEGQP